MTPFLRKRDYYPFLRERGSREWLAFGKLDFAIPPIRTLLLELVVIDKVHQLSIPDGFLRLNKLWKQPLDMPSS